jgi:hypothetical protein
MRIFNKTAPATRWQGWRCELAARGEVMARKAKSTPAKASMPSLRIVAAWLAAGIEEARIGDLCGVTPEQSAEVITAARAHMAEQAAQQAALQAEAGPAVRSHADWLRSGIYKKAQDLRFRLKLALTREPIGGRDVDAARDRIHSATAHARALWLAGHDAEAESLVWDARELLGMMRHDPASVDRAAQKARSVKGVQARQEIEPDCDSSMTARVKHAKNLRATGRTWAEVVDLVARDFYVTPQTARKDCIAAGRNSKRKQPG